MNELEMVAEHLEALSATWLQQSVAAKIGREANTRRDTAHSEYCRGRADAYLIAAGKIREAIEGV